MVVIRALKAIVGFFFGIISFIIATIGYAISYESYSTVKKTGMHGRSISVRLKDWVMPYSPENYWTNRGKNYFEEAQKGKRELPDSSREIVYRALIEALNRVSFNSLVEVGCGFGRNLKIIADSFSNKTLRGTDFSTEMLATAKDYLKLYSKIKVEKQDTRNLSFGNNSFDVVFSCESLLHIPKEGIRKAVGEMVRVSKKYILLIEPDLARTPFFQRFFHAKQVSFHNYPNLFRDAGMEPFYSKSIPYQFRTVYIFKKKK